MKLVTPSSKGFTLIEIMIVLVILAVLAGLAIPAYNSSVEKSRKQEAIAVLGAVRGSQQRYMATKNTYATTYAQLDFDPTLTMTGNQPHFSYAAPSSVTATAYNVIATRLLTIDNPGTPPGAYTVQINQDGVITSTY